MYACFNWSTFSFFLIASAKQGDVFQAKWGPGGVDRPSRSSYCPIHIAISYGHVVRFYIVSSGILKLIIQGPVVQSVVSLTSSLRVISLTVLADSIYNILIFFA